MPSSALPSVADSGPPNGVVRGTAAPATMASPSTTYGTHFEARGLLST
jgi:hypothetical protein